MAKSCAGYRRIVGEEFSPGLESPAFLLAVISPNRQKLVLLDSAFIAL